MGKNEAVEHECDSKLLMWTSPFDFFPQVTAANSPHMRQVVFLLVLRRLCRMCSLVSPCSLARRFVLPQACQHTLFTFY